MLVKNSDRFGLATFDLNINSRLNYELYSCDGSPIVEYNVGRTVEGCIHFSERDVRKCGHDNPAYKWDNGDVCIVLVKDGETCPAR